MGIPLIFANGEVHYAYVPLTCRKETAIGI
jgi:hypothetical protein